MSESSSTTRRVSSCRTGCVCESSGPTSAKATANRPMISVAMDAIRVASRRSAVPKSVPARMMPAAHDANANLGTAGHRQRKSLAVHASGRPELVARDNCCRNPGELRREGKEIAQYCGDKGACGTPQSQAREKSDAVLRETGGQHHDRYPAHDRADHAVPALAQRSAKMGLANQSRGRSGPVRIVELEPERDVKRETDRDPQPQAKEQRWARRSYDIRHPERGGLGQENSERHRALVGRPPSFGLGEPRTSRSSGVADRRTARASRPDHTVSDRRSDITRMTPASSDDGKDREDARFQCRHVVTEPADRPYRPRPDQNPPGCSRRTADLAQRLPPVIDASMTKSHQQWVSLITRHSCAAV